MDAHDIASELNKPIRFQLSATTIRIIAIQILFLGLLFLPDYSLYRVPLGNDSSMILYTLSQFMNNPAFYILLIVVALVFTFSFKLRLDDLVSGDGSVSVGSLFLRTAIRILVLYIGIFILSWLFLVYKQMFMGTIYINEIVLKVLLAVQ